MPIPNFLPMVGATGPTVGTQPVTSNTGQSPQLSWPQVNPPMYSGFNPNPGMPQTGSTAQVNPFQAGSPEWYQWEMQHKQMLNQYKQAMTPQAPPAPGQRG